MIRIRARVYKNMIFGITEAPRRWVNDEVSHTMSRLNRFNMKVFQ